MRMGGGDQDLKHNKCHIVDDIHILQNLLISAIVPLQEHVQLNLWCRMHAA